MVADIAVTTRLVPEAVELAEPCEPHWDLLGRLEKGPIGARQADAVVSVRRREPAACFLYGPYMHLPAGRYRLRFRCRCGRPRLAAQPVLGVEVIVLSRFQLRWADFDAGDLAGGTASLDFAVPSEHSLEGENEGRFEFRFFHFGNADLTITAIELDALPPDADFADASRWRLLGRLRKSWIGRRAADGGVVVRRGQPRGCLLYGGWPYLRLPRGSYRLEIRAVGGLPRRPGEPALGIEVFGNSRWLSRRPLRRLARRPESDGVLLAHGEFAAESFGADPITVDFSVPTELALEAGADAPVDIRLEHLGNAALTIEAVDLVRLTGGSVAELPAPRLRPSGRRKVVIVGNCQAETLRQGFAHLESLNRRFEVKYHFVQLPKNLHEFAARDLETCDILLIQDIRLWDQFPLRDSVRPAAESLRFPPVRFASLWPFDEWNGPGDRLAHEREGPNLTFPYLDGLLARLRREIPDPEARFAAYRDLHIAGVVNYRRLHDLEERRLAAMDGRFDCAIGRFILENFQNRRIFHTTVRPNWQVFSLLMQLVAGLVGVREPVALSESIDASLCNPQIPVHPKVARDLGVGWADQSTQYLNHGIGMTWERYIRRYIEHYG